MQAWWGKDKTPRSGVIKREVFHKNAVELAMASLSKAKIHNYSLPNPYS